MEAVLSCNSFQILDCIYHFSHLTTHLTAAADSFTFPHQKGSQPVCDTTSSSSQIQLKRKWYAQVQYWEKNNLHWLNSNWINSPAERWKHWSLTLCSHSDKWKIYCECIHPCMTYFACACWLKCALSVWPCKALGQKKRLVLHIWLLQPFSAIVPIAGSGDGKGWK